MKLIQILEALLFVADEPISSEEFAKSLEVPIGDVDEALDDLMKQCQESRGIQLMKIAGGFQLCTKPELALIIAQFTKPRKNKLTRSQLEVLAVVAYQQPVTMAEIDAVRGVQSDHSLRALLDRRLVHELGRKPTPGRPLLYGTSDHFMHQFALADLGELPPINLPESRSALVESTEVPS